LKVGLKRKGLNQAKKRKAEKRVFQAISLYLHVTDEERKQDQSKDAYSNRE
jgi:hypothetical protein